MRKLEFGTTAILLVTKKNKYGEWEWIAISIPTTRRNGGIKHGHSKKAENDEKRPNDNWYVSCYLSVDSDKICNLSN